MRLIIVRHGHTDALEQGIVQGHRFGKLNQRGEEQAERVAKRLAKEPIDVVYSSDLDRAKATTAHIIAYHPGVPVHYDPALRERSSGTYEGQAREKFMTAQDQSGVHWHHWRPEGGESLEDLFARVKHWFIGLAGQHRGQIVLIVSHGGAIRSLLSLLFDGPEFKVNAAFSHDNTGVTMVDVRDPSQPLLQQLNNTAHLEGLET